jgi:MoaA/NifB/PqqE/SkfB family radical SAM enzyme
MPHSYSVADFVHFARLRRRHQRRQRTWGRQFEAALRDGSYRMSHPTVVQLLPTEACNLRCPMCNQWGDRGYFLAGARQAQHMDPDALAALLRGLDAEASLVSVHGGEPFAYRHTDRMLDLLAERQFDVIFSTNGTLLGRHVDGLARLRNLGLLLSVDGDEAAHDRVRGAGTFRRILEAMDALFEARRRAGAPSPFVMMSFVVCEWNGDAIPGMPAVAREMGAFALNYNLRWFLSPEAGQAYEAHLQAHFGLRSSGAWRGWLSDRPDHDYRPAANAVADLMQRNRFRLRPPYVFTTPAGLGRRDLERYFSDYGEVFGNESCFMPFYWARVHSNGDLIYCPGHPDIVAGNVFRDGLSAAFNSEVSLRFRRHILGNRLPICNRCCGLYMTRHARPQERRVRRRLGLGPVQAHFPPPSP